MGMFFEWKENLKRYCKLNKKEVKASIITVLVIAFAISFNDWGPGSNPDIPLGLTNLLLAIIIVSISFYGRLFFQKAFTLAADYSAEYRMWSFGLLFTLLLAFVSNGRLWFLIPGGIVINFMPGHRVGWIRYSLNHFGMGVVSMSGPFANIILAIIFRILSSLTGFQIFETAFILNLVWALWTILPIPPADGSRMFFGSRMVYMYTVAVVVSSSILLYSKVNLLIAIFGSIAIAWVWWLVYYLVWERFNWKGPY